MGWDGTQWWRTTTSISPILQSLVPQIEKERESFVKLCLWLGFQLYFYEDVKII